MSYQPHKIYHIYNQGNNREPIFFKEENYKYFLRKVEKYFLPIVDVLCYCLMPNHFHFLVYTRPEACLPGKGVKPMAKMIEDQVELDYAIRSTTMVRQQLLSMAIGTLLSSYTKAINKQEERTGSLFRKRTKAKTGAAEYTFLIDQNVREKFLKEDYNYARTCFEYIHQNPVKAGLVNQPEEWIYSSARDFIEHRKKTICNLELAKKILYEPLE
jgi:putative transposase